MSLDTSLTPARPQDITLTIRLEGAHDIFRFAVNMLNGQVEFFAAGRVALVELREAMKPERFDPMAQSLLGEHWYAKLASYFLRDSFCASCEREIKAGEKFAPISKAQALCEECAGHYTPETSLVVMAGAS